MSAEIGAGVGCACPGAFTDQRRRITPNNQFPGDIIRYPQGT